MKKSIILGVMLAAGALVSVALAANTTANQKTEVSQKQEPKPKKAKKTPAQKVQHAEQKSNGKAFSGKGKGPAKSQSTKSNPKKVR